MIVDVIAIEEIINKKFDIVQSGYIFDIEELNDDVGIFPVGTDSATYYPLSEATLGLFGAFNPQEYAPYGVTNKWWTTPDGITFTEESPMPEHASHLQMGLRDDGFIWAWGKSQTEQPNPTVKSFVWKLNPTSKEWEVVSDDIGVDQFAQCGFLHKNYLYAFFVSSVDPITLVLKRSNDGITWDYLCDLPEYALDSYAWTDGNTIRFTGGGTDNQTLSEKLAYVYESTDDGLTFNIVSVLPENMRSVWPYYGLFKGYEIFIVGRFSQYDEYGVVYYRLLGSGEWIKAANTNRRFEKLATGIRHANSVIEWNDKLYITAGTRVSSFRISKV